MSARTEQLSLRGQWSVRLDPADVGIDEEWYAETFGESMALPGTTDEARLGDRTTDRPTERLSRRFEYEGAVWYQRTVTIPPSWENRGTELFLERTRPTTLWVDRTRVGSRESLTTPHTYDLTKLVEPGDHVLTLRVDNDAWLMTGEDTMLGDTHGVGLSHMATEHTQTNWNGVLGRIELRAQPLVALDDIQISTGECDGSWYVQPEVTVTNSSESAFVGRVHFGLDEGGTLRGPGTQSATVEPGTEQRVETRIEVDDCETWDEFAPSTAKLEVTVEAEDGTQIQSVRERFGFRTVSVDETQISINGRTTFLRGNCDCCVFPETGYAPMDVSSWRDVFETAKEYGLNHYRFHSWCPPEAAFRAADEVGVYLQPELPLWDPETALADDEMYEYYRGEAMQILEAYGNHPSFVLFALGNELVGNRERMAALVEACREADSRHLYAQGSNNYFTDPTLPDDDDFWITMRTGPADEPNTDVRGSYPSHDRGFVNNEPPSTEYDYRESIDGYDVPLISHEIGQYQAYPDFDEAWKYTGVLEPRNFDVFENHLAAHEMSDLAADFVEASGQLQVACYREEIEAALRTPGFGGFQLLALQDFPGQGTALVGVLDAHLDDKGFVAPERWREFCAPVVPLFRAPARTWTTGDVLTGEIEVAHYGPEDVADGTVSWTLSDETGEDVASGRFECGTIERGGLRQVGTVETPLEDTTAPGRVSMEVSVEELGARNRYDLWVYPEDVAVDDSTGATLTRTLSEAREALEHGGDVLFFPDPDDLRFSVEGAFQPDFWNYSHFKDRGNPGTMGLLVDEDHPSLADFPTDGHSDWQWWHIVEQARPVELDDMPDSYRSAMDRGYRPIVQAIDTPYRNRKLGVLFEMCVGDGNLLVCTAPLPEMTDQPAARQLYHSLYEYVSGPSFDPEEPVTAALLEKLFG